MRDRISKCSFRLRLLRRDERVFERLRGESPNAAWSLGESPCPSLLLRLGDSCFDGITVIEEAPFGIKSCISVRVECDRGDG